jgi:hypothetical protein
MPWLDALRSICTTLWVGGIWTIGAIVAPMLFRLLDSKPLAGRVAGELFVVMAWVGMVCGVYLVLWWLLRFGLKAFSAIGFWLLLGMLGLTLLNHFAIFPILMTVRSETSAAAQGLFGGGLASWHAISTVLYMIQSLLALFYVCRRENA